MFVTPGRTKQLGKFMSGRGEIACMRCKELKRKDKLVVAQTLPGKIHPMVVCKHCRSVLVYQLRQLEKVALLSD
jgi:hypothetical protein